MLRYLILAAVFLFPFAVDSYIIHVSMKHHKSPSDVKPNSNISCICDGVTKVLKLPVSALDRVFNSIQKQDFCGGNTAPKMCNFLMKCKNCTAVAATCERNSQPNENYDCYTKLLEMREKYMINKYDKKHAPKIFLAAQNQIEALRQAG